MVSPSRRTDVSPGTVSPAARHTDVSRDESAISHKHNQHHRKHEHHKHDHHKHDYPKHVVESQGRHPPFPSEERHPSKDEIPVIDSHTTQESSGGQHTVSPAARRTDAASVGNRGHHRIEERCPGAMAIPGIDGDEAMVATREDYFYIYEDRPPRAEAMVARHDDTQEENHRQHEQEQMRHERDEAISELDQYRQMVDNAVVVTPFVATNGDEEQEEMHHELAQLCQIVEKPVLVTPLVAPNSDEELGNGRVAQVPKDSNCQKDAVTEALLHKLLTHRKRPVGNVSKNRCIMSVIRLFMNLIGL